MFDGTEVRDKLQALVSAVMAASTFGRRASKSSGRRPRPDRRAASDPQLWETR